MRMATVSENNLAKTSHPQLGPSKTLHSKQVKARTAVLRDTKTRYGKALIMYNVL